MTPSPALAALRTATSKHHDAVEAALRIGRPEADRADFLAYLQALHGWLASFEAALWNAPWPAELEVQERAQKTRWIEADLKQAGLDAASVRALPRPEHSLALSTPAERFGVAYVIEGAQLGGQVLLKRLGPRLAPLQSRWLEGYGAQTGTRWKGFLQALERHVVNERDIQSAAASAAHAFASLQSWMRRQGCSG